ncbi:hypothetical protein ACFL0L_03480 [Patescibacteria group bacterium]
MKNHGSWKKERATGRKYSKSDVHKTPKAHTRKKYWVGDYQKKDGTHIKGHFQTNPFYKK